MKTLLPDGRSPWLLLSAVAAATLVTYWIGLQGPYLLDDQVAMKGIGLWHEGKITLWKVLANNSSWLTHRALAMGSFALNASITGLQPFGFKLGNLLLHVATGLVAYGWIRVMLRKDPNLGGNARWVGAIIVSVWLLHPLNVSTVLYVVQRMAQLAAVCCLAGMWLYVVLRNKLESAPNFKTWLLLYASIALLTLLGIQAKQSAACLPALCLVIELAYFRTPAKWQRPLAAFYLLSLALPVAAGIALLIARPESLGYGYGAYPFTPVQRVLTEGRVLVDYMRLLLVPYTPAMGLATDTFSTSTSLTSPVTTLFSWLALILVTAGAWACRKRFPAVFAGWGVFLVAHGIEASFLGLELYYEHRNYLPAFGLFIAVAGLIAPALGWLQTNGVRPARIGAVILVALLVALMLLTHGRSRVWSDMRLLAESDLQNRPTSVRATVVYLEIAVSSRDTDRAYEVIDDVLRRSSVPQQRALTRLYKVRVDCVAKHRALARDLRVAAQEMPPFVDVQTLLIYDILDNTIRQGCRGVASRDLADSMAAAADRAAHQPDEAQTKWFARYHAAYLYAEEGLWPQALAQARLSWQPSTNAARAPLLIAALVRTGHIDEARQVFAQAKERTREDSRFDAELLERMEQMIAHPEADIDLPALVGN